MYYILFLIYSIHFKYYEYYLRSFKYLKEMLIEDVELCLCFLKVFNVNLYLPRNSTSIKLKGEE